MSGLGDAAAGYADQLGWPVFPIEPRGKRPLTTNGHKAASTDPQQIAEWWARWPTANIGLPTGAGFDVLDLDGPEAEALFDSHVLAGGLPFPEPCEALFAETGRGLHALFEATGLGNRAGVLPGVDWRGAGGYIVAAPSIHPTGAVYRWAESPYDRPPPPCPDWLAELVRGEDRALAATVPGKRLDPRRGDATAYGLAALEGICNEIAAAQPGARNHTLNTGAYRAYRLAAGGEVTDQLTTDWLTRAAAHAGLGGVETARTLQSARAAGLQRPTRPERRVS